MSAPTHIEIYISAMKNDGIYYARLAERSENADFYDVDVRQVETDPLHNDWTGEIEIIDEAEDIATYEQAVKIAEGFCEKYGLPTGSWEDEGG